MIGAGNRKAYYTYVTYIVQYAEAFNYSHKPQTAESSGAVPRPFIQFDELIYRPPLYV
jgi:hypothetical protein